MNNNEYYRRLKELQKQYEEIKVKIDDALKKDDQTVINTLKTNLWIIKNEINLLNSNLEKKKRK